MISYNVDGTIKHQAISTFLFYYIFKLIQLYPKTVIIAVNLLLLAFTFS